MCKVGTLNYKILNHLYIQTKYQERILLNGLVDGSQSHVIIFLPKTQVSNYTDKPND